MSDIDQTNDKTATPIALHDCLSNCNFSKALLGFMRELRDVVGDDEGELSNEELLDTIKAKFNGTDNKDG